MTLDTKDRAAAVIVTFTTVECSFHQADALEVESLSFANGLKSQHSVDEKGHRSPGEFRRQLVWTARCLCTTQQYLE